MQILPKLRALVLSGFSEKKIFFDFVEIFNKNLIKDTPLMENSDYRLEILISVRRLERLDKDEYLDEERTEAEEIYEQRRLKEQEEAAMAAEESNLGDAEKSQEFEKADNED